MTIEPGFELVDLGTEDAERVIALLRAASVAGTLGRDPDEYDVDDVRAGLAKAVSENLLIGATAGDRLIGLIQGARLQARRFRHVLSGLTIAVAPSHQGIGIGRRLFEAFIDRADRLHPPVRRIELMLQAGNPVAVRLYEKLGFEEEGRLRGRVRAADGAMIDDIFMARLRPAADLGAPPPRLGVVRPPEPG